MKLFQKKHSEQLVYDRKKIARPDPNLLKEIDKVKLEMDYAYENFQNVLDPDLIDCYIYECNAAQKRYHFLLKQLKN